MDFVWNEELHGGEFKNYGKEKKWLKKGKEHKVRKINKKYRDWKARKN
jgi:hypothetical protein